MTRPRPTSPIDLIAQTSYGSNFNDLASGEQKEVINALSGLQGHQSRANAGRSWWLRQMLDQLEDRAGKEISARGRSEYRNGKVQKKIGISPFAATGRVKNSRGASHHTALYFHKRNASHSVALARAIAGNPKFYLDYSEGRLSEGLFGIPAPDGMPLIDLRRGMSGACSCFESFTCKHMIALGNAIADIFEKDLGAALEFFGIESEALAVQLQECKPNQESGSTPVLPKQIYDEFGWPIMSEAPLRPPVRNFWRDLQALPSIAQVSSVTPLDTAAEITKNRISGANGSMSELFAAIYESIDTDDSTWEDSQ